MTVSPPEVSWLGLERARRRRIGRAVRRGLAVEDPRDAPYAVGVADATLEWLSWRTRFRPLHLLLLVVLFAEIGFTWSWRPDLLVYPLLVFAWLRLRAPRLRRKIAQSRAANAALLEQLGLKPVVVQMPARDFFRPRSRLRRGSLAFLTVLLAATLALAATAAVSAHRRAQRWAAAANRICSREDARIAGLQAALGRLERQRQTNVAEEQELTALERLMPEERRSDLQTRFLAWKRYKLELDLWLLDGLARRDASVIAGYPTRARSAREHYSHLARSLGARNCADA
jgi:hypothetical protein